MKSFFAYARYFFYLAFNWNIRLALFIIKHEVQGEKKYHIDTTGIDDLTGSVPAEEREHASIYQPVNFYTAETLMNTLKQEDIQTGFLDIGCGKGRMLAMAAFYGFKEITGVEFSPQLCHDAVERAEEIELGFAGIALTIECEDARNYEIPGSVSVIFMFNPFDDLVMEDFLKKVEQSLEKYPRHIKLLYANPVCRRQLLDKGFAETFHFKKLKYLEGSVFEKGF